MFDGPERVHESTSDHVVDHLPVAVPVPIQIPIARAVIERSYIVAVVLHVKFHPHEGLLDGHQSYGLDDSHLPAV